MVQGMLKVVAFLHLAIEVCIPINYFVSTFYTVQLINHTVYSIFMVLLANNNHNLGTMSTTRVQGKLYYLKKAIEEQHGINQNLRT